MGRITEQKARNAMKEWLDADINLGKIQADKRAHITPIVQQYEEKEKVEIGKKEDAQAIIEAFASQQRDELFADGKKSTAFSGGTIGFKTSPAKLVSDDWDKALELVKEWNPEFIIEKCEIDKKGILRNAGNFEDEDLKGLGLSITQEEKFYVKA